MNDEINKSIVRAEGLSFSGNQVYLAQPLQLKKLPNSTCKGDQIFLHMPKCAGTTLDTIMSACSYYIKHEYIRYPITKFTPPVYIRPGWMGAWYSVKNAEITYKQRCFISGHFPFGIHDLLGREGRYITILRDPVIREISSFNFHYQRGYINDKDNILQLIDDGDILDNPQTRMLAGIHAMEGVCTDQMYYAALNNISTKFDLVGLAESADEFIQILLGLNDWPPVLYNRSQITGIKLIDTPSDELRSKLESYHKYDLKLYHRAKVNWDRWKNKHVKGLRLLKMTDDVVYIPQDYQKTGQSVLLKVANLQKK